MAPSEPSPIPGLPGVMVQRDVPCQMRDGVTLLADIYRPEGAGPFPVILMRLPVGPEDAVIPLGPAWVSRRRSGRARAVGVGGGVHPVPP